MFKRIPGTRDILPEESAYWQQVELISRRIFSAYNYKEIRTPILEDLSLFNRSLGETAEIVQKQMFLVQSKEDNYVLRPEATASVVRAYIENNLDKTDGFSKLYYMGPMFRFERPQKGRLRQFHHIGCEVIGSSSADIDVEIIALADELLAAYLIQGYKIKINSLGCKNDKAKLTQKLKTGLQEKLSSLCEDCQARFEKNVLRILDCKQEKCTEIVRSLKIGSGHLCEECSNHFQQVQTGLNALHISYEISPYLVRGLDYYTRTIFEIKHADLGSQDAIGAGGRYDTLVNELGGPALGAIGFAFGVERLLLVSKLKPQTIAQELTYIIALGDAARAFSLKLLQDLRKNGVSCDTDYESKTLKGAMRKANDAQARYVVIIGENELTQNAVTLKDMKNSQQRIIAVGELLKELKC